MFVSNSIVGLMVIFQGQPTRKLSEKPLKDISRLLVIIYKDSLNRCFDQLEQFDLFGYLSLKIYVCENFREYLHFRNC